MGHKPNYKEIWAIFFILALLTALEVGLAYVTGINWTLMVSALCLLAVVKAALVGLFYMHLKHEKPVLQWTVLIPMLVPILYALVLIGEASWRLAAQ